MSEALQVIDVPAIRPPGVTKRQWRLAALLPRCETAAEALRLAGYAPSTINGKSGRQSALVGVRRAQAAIEASQADRARGLLGFGEQALADKDALFADMNGAARATIGLQAIKLAHEIGENIEQRGNGEAWKLRLRRACRLMARLTEARLLRPLDVVLSPPIIESQSK